MFGKVINAGCNAVKGAYNSGKKVVNKVGDIPDEAGEIFHDPVGYVKGKVTDIPGTVSGAVSLGVTNIVEGVANEVGLSPLIEGVRDFVDTVSEVVEKILQMAKCTAWLESPVFWGVTAGIYAARTQGLINSKRETEQFVKGAEFLRAIGATNIPLADILPCAIEVAFYAPLPEPGSSSHTSAVNQNGETVLYNAIWIRTRQDRPAVYSWKRSDLDKQHAEMTRQGYQLDTINAFALRDGSERYNAIWIKTRQPRPFIYAWKREDLDKKNIELNRKGYRFIELNAFVLPGGQVRYNAVWIKTNQDRPALYAWKREDFDKKNTELCRKGYRLVEVNTFVLPGGQGERYNGIWVHPSGMLTMFKTKNQKSDRPFVYAWGREDFDKKTTQLNNEGYKLQELNSYTLPGGRGERYNAVWSHNRTDCTAAYAWVRKDFDKVHFVNTNKGYRLLKINATVTY